MEVEAKPNAVRHPAWANQPAGPLALSASPILPDIEDVVVAIAERDGNLDDAARALHIDRSTITKVLTDSPTAPLLLAQQVRLQTTLRTYQALASTHRAMLEKLDEMSAFELSRTFTNLSASLAALTDKHESTQNVNITEVALRMLPPEARIALKELAAGTEE